MYINIGRDLIVNNKDIIVKLSSHTYCLKRYTQYMQRLNNK